MLTFDIGIDTEHRRTSRFGDSIHSSRFPADKFKVTGGLERRGFWRLHTARRFNEIAVGILLAAIDHEPVIRFQFSKRSIQVHSGGSENQGSSVCTNLPKLGVMRVNRVTTARCLHTHAGVVVILVDTSKKDLHRERVEIKLFTENRGEARRDALPHFIARRVKL